MAITTEDWLQAQYSVLGAALLETDLVAKVMSETTENDYSGACKTVYRAMSKLFLDGAVVDPVSLASALGSDYRSFLMDLMQVTPTAANIDYYIPLCREQAKVITFREIGQRMAEAENHDAAGKLLEQANGLMADRPSVRIVTMSDALKSFMERHTGEVKYMSWPVRELNDRLYTELGDFVIFAGYPSAGKSAWALQCAWHWAKHYKVGFFSLETSTDKLFDRQMSTVAEVSKDHIKRNTIQQSDWEHIAELSSVITKRNLELIPAAGYTPAEIRAITMMRGYEIILIDYLQLLQSNGMNRTEQVTNISLALHTMAQSMNVLVVALSQLKRRSQGREKPDMSDLRESGQIEQDADLVMILSLEDEDKPEGNRVMNIAKNKEGTCPNILLAFNGRHQAFSKAQSTGKTAEQYASVGRAAKRHRSTEPGQMEMLPFGTPIPEAWEKD